MKPNAIALLVLAAAAPSVCARAQAQPPPWVSEKFGLLRRLQIDPSADLAEVANYHWSWTSRREVVAGGFQCPTGSSVDVSRSIVVVRPPTHQACEGRDGAAVQMLKVFPDGSAKPLE